MHKEKRMIFAFWQKSALVILIRHSLRSCHPGWVGAPGVPEVSARELWGWRTLREGAGSRSPLIISQRFAVASPLPHEWWEGLTHGAATSL